MSQLFACVHLIAKKPKLIDGTKMKKTKGENGDVVTETRIEQDWESGQPKKKDG